MAYEIRKNTGSTFKNQKKESENHPNLTGSALICCAKCDAENEFWMSGWTKKDKNGNPWQSWAFKTKEEKQDAKPTPKQQPKNNFEDMSDDCPF